MTQVTYSTRAEAIEREIIEPIEAGDVEDARAAYDVDAIADAVLDDYAGGYACTVDADDFWAITMERMRVGDAPARVDYSTEAYGHVRDTANIPGALDWADARYTLRLAHNGGALTSGRGPITTRHYGDTLFAGGLLTRSLTKALGNNHFLIAGRAPYGSDVILEVEGAPALDGGLGLDTALASVARAGFDNSFTVRWDAEAGRVRVEEDYYTALPSDDPTWTSWDGLTLEGRQWRNVDHCGLKEAHIIGDDYFIQRNAPASVSMILAGWPVTFAFMPVTDADLSWDDEAGGYVDRLGELMADNFAGWTMVYTWPRG